MSNPTLALLLVIGGCGARRAIVEILEAEDGMPRLEIHR